MNGTVDELTVNYEEDGILRVKEVDKEILSRGAWATVLFRYREWMPEADAYGPPLQEKCRGIPPAVQIHHFQRGSGPAHYRRAGALAGAG